MDIRDMMSLYRDGGESFDTDFHGKWMRKNWWMSFVISAVYLVAVFGGIQYMKDRKAFDLRRPLMLWSAGFAIFSFWGTVNTWPDFIQGLMGENGWHNTICASNFYNGRIGLWAWLYAMSKVAELGDTFFIVARKRKLLFIHWYHHVFTFVYSWYSHRDYISTGRIFATLNFGVHFVMYTYYAISAAKIMHIPKQMKVGITLVQLSQFFISIAATYHTVTQIREGLQCGTNAVNIAWSIVLYLSFLYFFIRFFYDAYVKPNKRASLKNE